VQPPDLASAEAPSTPEQWRRLDEETIAAHCDAIRGARPVPPTLLAVVLGAAPSKLPSGDPRRLTDLGMDDDPHAEARALMRNELAESMVRTRRRRMGRGGTGATTTTIAVAR
jgi:hypothetical protein